MWHHSKAQPGERTAGNLQNPDETTAMLVLQAFGWAYIGGQIEAVPSGFSGAAVWKVTCRNQSYALKRWSAGQPVYLDLPMIHQLMTQARQAGLTAIPEVCKTGLNETTIHCGNSDWDACSWQPGQPDHQPSDERLKSAMELLSRLHSVWRTSHERRFDVCPAVMLQHRRLLEWKTDELDKLKYHVASSDHFHDAVILLEQLRPQALQRLTPWLNRRVTLHPCLGDVWSDHVLFEGKQATGLIDFGGVRYDHPAQDLARLIGSYTQGDALRREFAFDLYAPTTPESEALTILLDDCGTIVGLGNWLRWLFLEGRHFADQQRAIARLDLLLNRLSRRNRALL